MNKSLKIFKIYKINLMTNYSNSKQIKKRCKMLYNLMWKLIKKFKNYKVKSKNYRLKLKIKKK